MDFANGPSIMLGGFDLVPVLVAIVVGSAVGLERQFHGRPAGLRTHVLVCLSATLLIHASRNLPQLTGDVAEGLVFDPNRLAAGIVTGVGFLGAAAVIRSGDIVRGITTGACLWAVACLGVVVGQGHYAIALGGAFTMWTVLVLFDHLFSWISPVIYRKLVVHGHHGDLEDIREAATGLLTQVGVVVQDITCRLEPAAGTFDLTLHVRGRSNLVATELVDRVVRLSGVQAAEWVSIDS